MQFSAYQQILSKGATSLILRREVAKGNVLTAQELLADFPAERHPVLLMSLAWLAKLGIVDWLEPDLKVLRFY